MSERGRYDNLHGDEDEIAASRPERPASSCPECGSTDGCLCRVETGRLRNRICSICGAMPCESPSACRSQARRENDVPEDREDAGE